MFYDQVLIYLDIRHARNLFNCYKQPSSYVISSPQELKKKNKTGKNKMNLSVLKLKNYFLLHLNTILDNSVL